MRLVLQWPKRAVALAGAAAVGLAFVLATVEPAAAEYEGCWSQKRDNDHKARAYCYQWVDTSHVYLVVRCKGENRDRMSRVDGEGDIFVGPRPMRMKATEISCGRKTVRSHDVSTYA
jgi:hypothetical protein